MGSDEASQDVLTFDAETHTYKINGVVVPSVTQVLDEGGFIDKTWFTEGGRNRGTYVAQATQFDDEGALNWDALDDKLKGYVTAWRGFLKDTKWEVVAIEQRVHNPEMGYAGTLDRIMDNGYWRWVLDIKTGASQKWHSLQTAAYAACMERAQKRASLVLKENGTYKLHEHTGWGDRRVFYAALSCYHWKAAMGQLNKGAD